MRPSFGEDYQFSWADLGNVGVGRPNLGGDVPVLVYRLAQFTVREALEQHFGEETACVLLREAGWIAGREFCRNVLNPNQDFAAFMAGLRETLRELKIGLMEIEEANFDSMSLVLTLSEDPDCSGVPVYGTTVCDYDEGFLEGILHAYTGRNFNAVEVACWATGDRTCRFEIRRAVAGQEPGCSDAHQG